MQIAGTGKYPLKWKIAIRRVSQRMWAHTVTSECLLNLEMSRSRSKNLFISSYPESYGTYAWCISTTSLSSLQLWSRTVTTYKRHLTEILRDAGVSLKLIKCSLFQEKVNYLGHTVMPGKLAAAIDITSAVLNALLPTDKTKLRSFLGDFNV